MLILLEVGSGKIRIGLARAEYVHAKYTARMDSLLGEWSAGCVGRVRASIRCSYMCARCCIPLLCGTHGMCMQCLYINYILNKQLFQQVCILVCKANGHVDAMAT